MVIHVSTDPGNIFLFTFSFFLPQYCFLDRPYWIWHTLSGHQMIYGHVGSSAFYNGASLQKRWVLAKREINHLLSWQHKQRVKQHSVWESDLEGSPYGGSSQRQTPNEWFKSYVDISDVYHEHLVTNLQHQHGCFLILLHPQVCLAGCRMCILQCWATGGGFVSPRFMREVKSRSFIKPSPWLFGWGGFLTAGVNSTRQVGGFRAWQLLPTRSYSRWSHSDVWFWGRTSVSHRAALLALKPVCNINLPS